jgi:replicative DNA helicase
MLINQLDHEECVLGYALACYNTTAAKAIAMLSPDDMSSDSTKWLIGAINKVASRGHPVDVFTVDTERQIAERNGRVPSVCTLGWMMEIAKNSIGANIEARAKIIRANAAMRKAVEQLDSLKAEILDSQDPVKSMQAAKDALLAMDFGVDRKKPRQLYDLAKEYTEARIDIYEGNKPAGIKLQPDGMSHAFGTIGMSDFIVIAGRPGSGKTELSVAVANELAIAQGKAVLYKSLEMDGLELAERALLSLSGLAVDAVETKIFEGNESGFFGMALDRCADKPFYVDDSSGCTVEDIVIQCKEFCAEHPNVGALIVDYVGLMEVGGSFSRHDLAIGHITRKLKLLAKEQKIPVFGLFQLSRDVEKRIGNRRPVAADLRDSGSIEQDADKIVIVHRDCINNPQTPMKNVAELLNVKRRRGQPTNGYMEFKNGHFMPIPDEEQTRWRIASEESPAPQKNGSGKGFNLGDKE